MKIRLGIIGLGTVGRGVLTILKQQADFFKNSLGLEFEIVGICARTEASLNRISIENALKTTDPLEICRHPKIDIVLELAGGYEEPRLWVLTALEHKKHVITANKALLAQYGGEIFPLAKKAGQSLQFEAAIGGAIPIVKTLQEALIGNEITGIACIINGTSNFILSEMTEKGMDFSESLKTAQDLGYAEADPSFDIEGVDSAHKVALIASLSFGKFVDFQKMHVEGINHISKLDVNMAAELGFHIKLLGVVNSFEDGSISANVYPAFVPESHQLFSVRDVTNAIYIEGSASGPLLLTGAGAGELPTASSVIGDLMALAGKIQSKSNQFSTPGFISLDNPMHMVSIHDLEFEFYLRFTTVDHPGVLAKITKVLADCEISIKSFIQKTPKVSDKVPVIILTHKAKNDNVYKALDIIESAGILSSRTNLLRFYP